LAIGTYSEKKNGPQNLLIAVPGRTREVITGRGRGSEQKGSKISSTTTAGGKKKARRQSDQALIRLMTSSQSGERTNQETGEKEGGIEGSTFFVVRYAIE